MSPIHFLPWAYGMSLSSATEAEVMQFVGMSCHSTNYLSHWAPRKQQKPEKGSQKLHSFITRTHMHTPHWWKKKRKNPCPFLVLCGIYIFFISSGSQKLSKLVQSLIFSILPYLRELGFSFLLILKSNFNKRPLNLQKFSMCLFSAFSGKLQVKKVVKYDILKLESWYYILLKNY